MVLCQTCTTMKLAQGATADITAQVTKMLNKVMTEEEN